MPAAAVRRTAAARRAPRPLVARIAPLVDSPGCAGAGLRRFASQSARGEGLMEAASVSRHDPTTGESARERQVLPSWTPADPGPLGLAAFALTTFVLSMFNANLVGGSGEPVVFGLALAYGGLVQLLAGMWEFRTGNTFGAVAFCSFGGIWLSFWAYVQFFAAGVPASHAGSAVGLYLIAWGIFTSYMFVASLRTSAAVCLVFILLAVTFFVLGIGEANGSASTTHVGGWLGLATAVAAWYASFSAVTNATFGRAVLPNPSLKPAPRA
jgi:succinate-acetate transporter protein